MRQKLKTGILLFLLSLLFTIPCYAAETDAWLTGWDYQISDGNVLLKSYAGEQTELDIYGKATVDGTIYNTVIAYDNSSRRSALAGNTGISGLFFHAVDGTKVRYQQSNAIDALFENMSALERISFSDGFDTSGVKTFTSVFRNCTSLISVDIENLDFSSATTYNSLFSRCKSLESVNMSSLDYSSVDVLSYMFEGCSNLKSIDLSGKTWLDRGVNVSSMINGCNSLEEIIVDENVRISNWSYGIGSPSEPTKLRIVGEMSDSFKTNFFAKFRSNNWYIEAINVRASIIPVGDNTYDSLSYGLEMSGTRGVKILENDGSDEICFKAGEHDLYIYEPGEYTFTLRQGFRITDEGDETVEAVYETDDGFTCSNPVISKTIRVIRNTDGSIGIEEV